jgi:hypothetical protein
LPRERIRTLLEERREIEVIGECRDGQEAVNTILAGLVYKGSKSFSTSNERLPCYR